MRPSCGFSLIEMLVVLFVIVLMTSMVSLNLDSGASARKLRDRMESLRAVAAYAVDEAQFTGSDFGALFVAESDERGDPYIAVYWRQRLPEGWRAPADATEVFAPLRFPASARVQLLLEGVEIVPAAAAAADPLSGVTPQWLLVSSGETQPGELLVRGGDDDVLQWRLSWDALARFEQFRGSEQDPVGDYALAP